MSTKLISVSVPAESINTYAFLRYGRGQSRFLWRDQALTIAGIGTASELFGWGDRRYREIEEGARQLYADLKNIQIGNPAGDAPVHPHLFGGFSFTSAFVPDVAWAAFYPAHFVLPHYQLTHIDDQSYLSINILVPNDEEIDPIVNEIKGSLEEMAVSLCEASAAFEASRPAPKPGLKDLSFPMSKGQWQVMLDQAIGSMRAGELDKVVLARICEIQLKEEISLTDILPNLADRYPKCNIFLFEPRPFNAFYGATPETLVDIEGKTLKTMGLAGSAKRGATPAEDEAFGNGLLDSEKNQIEHALVVEAIQSRLSDLTERLDIDEGPILMKLSNIQHLYTPIQGEFKDANGILPFVETLHPTPALGGKPRPEAMAFISEKEPITRGWYGAPVGFLTPELDGRFGVAIRSAVAQRQRVWAYAGAGIVADSQPEEEWEETAIKFRPMLDLFE